jgi:predicted amidophosphoribosyltransferase
LLPPRCGLCDEPLAARPRHGLCPHCLELVSANDGRRCGRCDSPGETDPCAACAAAPPPFARALAPYLYGGSLAEALVAVKFGGREHLAPALGRLLADATPVRELLAGASCLVPVPLGPRRRRRRGFNPSAVFARVLGREHGVPVRHALVRCRETGAQSELGLAERRANVAGAFTTRRPVSGVAVLVDDILTSGETARAGAVALLAGGASEVRVIALARTAVEDARR